MPKYKVIIDIDWDEAEIKVEDVKDFLNYCGEGYCIDTKVIDIHQIEE